MKSNLGVFTLLRQSKEQVEVEQVHIAEHCVLCIYD